MQEEVKSEVENQGMQNPEVENEVSDAPEMEKQEEVVEIVTDPVQRELLLLELNALNTMLGAVFYEPIYAQRESNQKKPPRLLRYEAKNAYSFPVLAAIVTRSAEITKMLGIEVGLNKRRVKE